MAKLDHVLSNGFTFLAVTAGQYGAWAKATDPMTAIRNAADENGYGNDKKVTVMCVYGKNGAVRAGEFGGIQWDEGAEPAPVGMFSVTPKAITSHLDCVKFIEQLLADVAESQKTEAA
jgi:hypothetical protein